MFLSSATSRRFLPYATASLVGAAAIIASLLYPPAPAGPRGPSPSPAPPAVPSRASAVELAIISGVDPSGVRQDLVDQWNAKHRHVHVSLREIAGDTYQQRNEIRAALEGGSAAIAVLDSIHLGEFAAPRDGAKEGLLAELTPDGTVTSGFLAGPLATCYWKKALYGLPFNTDVGLLFTAGGVPQPENWTGLIASAGASANRKQIALQLGADEAFVVNVLEQMLAVDPGILNARGTGNVVRRARWEAAVAPLKKAYKAGFIVGSASEDASTTAFKQGQVRYMRNWPAQFKKIDRPPAVRRLFGPGVLGGQNLVVSRRTPHRAEALEVLGFLTNPDSQQQLFRVGGFAPTRKTTYALPEVKRDVPYAAELLEAVEEARPRPITPKYEKVSRLILNNLRPAVLADRRIDDSFERDMMEALHE